MEIVLLWLDDLDDLFFSAALLWEGLRRVVLQVGLAAALTLAGADVLARAAAAAPFLAGVAAASVTAWLLGAALHLCYYYAPRTRLTAA